MKRQISDDEKQTVRQQQIAQDGSLRCFISGDIISNDDEIEYDHIQPYSKDGETSTSNIRIVLKKYNRQKSDQSLYEIRDNLRLERLFEKKKNNIKLQDILQLKDIQRKNTHVIKKDKKALSSRTGRYPKSSRFCMIKFWMLSIFMGGYLFRGWKTMIRKGYSRALSITSA